MKSILAAASLLVAPLLWAQTPYLVKDINVSATTSPNSSTPLGFYGFGSRTLFEARVFANQWALWSTDGTEEGTTRLVTFVSGLAPQPRFATLNGAVLFNARDSRGEELWTTDGTPSGTHLLVDINPISFASSPGDRIVFHNKMFFSANDGLDGFELWVTDGTGVGTHLFKDLAPGTSSSSPTSFVQLGDVFYFFAGSALWKSDGTEAGTVVVKSPVNANRKIVVAGGRLFFSVFTQETGDAPWVSDGTEAGTHIIKNILGSQSATYLTELTAFGGGVLFGALDPVAGFELWISDGTQSGTHVLRDLDSGPDSGYIGPIVVAGNTAFFTGATRATGRELWKTDGTEAGTVLVADIEPGKTSSLPQSYVLGPGNKVYFTAGSSLYQSLWMTDGTAAGTQRVQAKNPADMTASPALSFVNGLLYFSGANSLNGQEPWKSDGTSAGTAMIANLWQDSVPSSQPQKFFAAGDLIYFSAWDGTGTFTSSDNVQRSMWRSDGTLEGTVKLGDVADWTYQAAAGHTLFFTRSGELWSSDGTPQGTKPATSLANRFPSTPTMISGSGETVLASVGSALWSTSLAPNAPATPLGIAIGSGYTNVAGHTLFFGLVSDGAEILSTDGTSAGSYSVAKITDGHAYNGLSAVMGGQFYFPSGSKLWKTDGTFDGTVVVKTFPAQITNLVAAGSKLFLNVNQQLWVTDGTDAGSRQVTAPAVGAVLAPLADRVVFGGTDSSNDGEPWASDGTDAGTRRLRDIEPGTNASFPTDMVSWAGAVYFSAFDSLHGRELWVTDGTPEGTMLVADLEPGPQPSYPGTFVGAGSHFFFVANTSATGLELWALDAPSNSRLSVNDVRVGEGDSGSKTARFTITLSAASSKSVTVDYATSDMTATAGQDYDAASGTLTFLPGETAKSVDVRVLGDTTPENNESFFLTLKNATGGATFEKSTAYAVVDDDDQFADLALALDFSNFNSDTVIGTAKNNGPRSVTGIKVLRTSTPNDGSVSCVQCALSLQQLTVGATARAFDGRYGGIQRYSTATISGYQRDLQPSNNSVAWLTGTSIAMEALYLTPGAEARIWFHDFQQPATVNLESSNPAVISVPSTLAVGSNAVSFMAHGVAPGTATIRVLRGSVVAATLNVDVVAAGTKPRWPGALSVFADNSPVQLDKPVLVRLYPTGSAPYTGETASGPVTISSNGTVLAHVDLVSGGGMISVPIFFRNAGTQPLKVEYAGDANFLPSSNDFNVSMSRGNVTISAWTDRTGSSAAVHVRVTGSYLATPGGTITIGEAGKIPQVQSTLVPNSAGVGAADFVLNSVPAGQHTLLITYSGDSRYFNSTQNVRITDERRRSAPH